MRAVSRRARTMDELRALLFGATIAAAIGPIALLIIDNGMRHGLRAALASAAGVASADFAYALAAFAAGSGLAALLERMRQPFALSAGAILVAVGVWLALGALRAPAETARPARHPGFGATFLLTLANPLTIILFAGFSAQLSLSASLGDALYFAAFIFAGSLPVQACYALFGAAVRRFAPDARIIRTLNLLSSLGIIAFGVYGIARAV
jgi:threonine/homoserine/homoserine lactone efflux protein